MVANWLYGVAHQTALKARATTVRRRTREKQVTDMPERALEQQALRDDLQPLLDQELSRLPDKYRAVIVLCDLEGKTRKEAARHFHLPEGTVASRLATARAMLAKRLTRAGLAVSGAALAAVLAEGGASASVPPAVASSTIRAVGLFAAGQAAAGVVSGRAISLAEGVLKSMLLTRLKLVTAVLVALVVLGAGAIAWTHHVPAGAPADSPRTEPQGLAEEQVKEIMEGDWPQWRGPHRDGVVHGVRVPEKWPRTLQEEWRMPVGEGVASPVTAYGNVYVFTRQQENEVVLCLDLLSGKEHWRSEPYPAPYSRRPEERGFSKGPRSTPAVAGARVYTLGMNGLLSCLDARTGAMLWRKECSPKPAPTAPSYGGSSPLVADGLCIVHAGDGRKGGLTAFDALTGEVKWCCAEGYAPMSGSPILVDLAGERQAVTYSLSNVAGVCAATGQIHWRAGLDGAGQPHTTPVRYKDLLLVADILQPLRAVRVDRGDKGLTVKDVWKAKSLPLGYSSPVLSGDLVFGMSSRKNGCFFCLDANSGATLWESDGGQGDYASLVNAGSVLLYLTEKGRLIVVRPSSRAYEPIAEYQVSDTDTYAHPVFLGDRILIKDQTTLRSYRMEQNEARPRHFLDLQPHANQKLKEGFRRPGNSLATLPTGEQVLGGIRFKIGEGLIQLSSRATAKEMPQKAEEIKVGFPFSRLSILHATQWASAEGALVGYYTVRYEDNSRETIPMVFGKDVSNWWYAPGSPPPSHALVAWQGENDDARITSGWRIRLYASVWQNPHPARNVVSIDFASTNFSDPEGAQVAPFCVAMTVEK
jgi:outer membrane protein assembly factor BamB